MKYAMPLRKKRYSKLVFRTEKQETNSSKQWISKKRCLEPTFDLNALLSICDSVTSFHLSPFA